MKYFPSEWTLKLLIVLGLLLTLTSLAMGWGGVEILVKFIISQVMRLQPGSSMWEVWKTVPYPVHIKFHFFNVTLLKGEKPKLKELGPYVYRIAFDKVDIEVNKVQDTASYSPTKTYFFQPQLSSGKEDDLLNYINVMYLSVMHVGRSTMANEADLALLDRMLTEKGENLIRTDTVADVLFNGVSVQNYIDLLNQDHPAMKEIRSNRLFRPLRNGKVAIFKGKNGTKGAPWECQLGGRSHTELGKIRSYNGQKKLDLYSGDACNAINGTDGYIYPPFIDVGENVIHIFIPELCRSLTWEFETTHEIAGIPVARYLLTGPQTPTEDPTLSCFCQESYDNKCEIHGIANLEQCHGVPFLYSKPHFLHVPEHIANQVEGLKPSVKEHESRLDIHPLTGQALRTSVKMQFSIDLSPTPGFRNAPKAILPIMWVEVETELTGVGRLIVEGAAWTLVLLPFLRWVWLIGSGGLVFLSCFFYHRVKNGSLDQS